MLLLSENHHFFAKIAKNIKNGQISSFFIFSKKNQNTCLVWFGLRNPELVSGLKSNAHSKNASVRSFCNRWSIQLYQNSQNILSQSLCVTRDDLGSGGSIYNFTEIKDGHKFEMIGAETLPHRTKAIVFLRPSRKTTIFFSFLLKSKRFLRFLQKIRQNLTVPKIDTYFVQQNNTPGNVWGVCEA